MVSGHVCQLFSVLLTSRVAACFAFQGHYEIEEDTHGYPDVSYSQVRVRDQDHRSLQQHIG